MARLELVTFFRSNGLIKSGDRHQELVFEWGVGGVIKNMLGLGRVAMDKTEAHRRRARSCTATTDGRRGQHRRDRKRVVSEEGEV